MPKPVSLTAAAATLGLSRNTLAGWIAKGCPVVSKADRDRGLEWQLDIAAVHEWRIETAVKDAVAGYQTADGNISKDEADRRRAVALAILAEIEVDTAMKAVLLVSDAQEMMADFCQVLKQGIGNAVGKIAGRVHTTKHPAEIQATCEREFNRAFATAEQTLMEAWDRDGRPAPGTPKPDDDEPEGE